MTNINARCFSRSCQFVTNVWISLEIISVPIYGNCCGIVVCENFEMAPENVSRKYVVFEMAGYW